ncbi:MAG: thiamine phosphate synthase [Candidatus Dormibacteria bacterium]
MSSQSERSGAWRRQRLADARLYVVTGARGGGKGLDAFLDAVLGAGADIVQLRDKTAEARDLLRWSARFRAAAMRHRALFVLNDRPDVALAAGADGVHLGQGDLPPRLARGVVGAEMLIGLSTHSEAQFRRAPATVDYLCAGPVHATPTKPGRRPTGLGVLGAAARLTSTAEPSRPWFAIGGIDATNLGAALAAGAERIVVVRAVTEAADAAAATAELAARLPRPAAMTSGV